MPNVISEFQVTDHGVEHSQYFQGHGVALSRWTDCATGCGASAREAAQDAVEQLACAGFDLPAELFAEIDALSPTVDVPPDDSDCWHYVSVDVVA